MKHTKAAGTPYTDARYPLAWTIPMIVLAILLPWLAMLYGGRLLQGALCLGLQLTLVGWIPAAVWAVLTVTSDERERAYRTMVARLHAR